MAQMLNFVTGKALKPSTMIFNASTMGDALNEITHAKGCDWSVWHQGGSFDLVLIKSGEPIRRFSRSTKQPDHVSHLVAEAILFLTSLPDITKGE